MTAAARPPAFDLRWVLAVPLLFALGDAREFTRYWIKTERESPDVARVVEALRTPDLQWVDIPFGEHFWTERATAAGLKMSQGIHRWRWNGHRCPSRYDWPAAVPTPLS